MNKCPACGSDRISGTRYADDYPEHYDGISEWLCESCGFRRGRWSGRELFGEEKEPPPPGGNTTEPSA